ncbi:hypothetical protein ORJ04_03110 [Rheinheimera baltica]|uniref:Type II secretion system protein GspC N-terminal domain-containing protein n=1 Tax=Rheinheimera baltica TaxID=67576 RepID=A0ABT9HUY1_9GAMM|nr:hypothetical protein [Rheinheimera baltica]MDP5134934.1 hypothetical protein [Rheinheimera baltica]MDP5149815.1 hypothetical protein [Rheinheimera baltica]
MINIKAVHPLVLTVIAFICVHFFQTIRALQQNVPTNNKAFTNESFELIRPLWTPSDERAKALSHMFGIEPAEVELDIVAEETNEPKKVIELLPDFKPKLLAIDNVAGTTTARVSLEIDGGTKLFSVIAGQVLYGFELTSLDTTSTTFSRVGHETNSAPTEPLLLELFPRGKS